MQRDLQADLTALAELRYGVLANLLDSYELKKYRLPPLPSTAPRRGGGPDPKPKPKPRASSAARAPPITYPEAAAQVGLEVLSYPGGIVEMLAPPDVAVAHAYLERLAQQFREGQGIVMHCRAGVGRAGMMAAMFLLLTGEADNATQAIALVRQRRCPRAVESRQQEQFVELYARFLESEHLSVAR
eukprot:EG_transcript_29789